MGIRIRGNYASNAASAPSSGIRGFKIRALTDKVYDLDSIIANHSRSNSEMPLILQVKDDKAIKNAVIKKFTASLQCEVESIVDDSKDKICDIIESNIQKYGINDINSLFFSSYVLKAINAELNSYLRSKLGNNLVFDVNIEGTSQTIDILYDFTSETAFESALTSIYEKYKNEIIDVNVGGVAISGSKTGSIRRTNSDYKKYLSSGCKDTPEASNIVSTAGVRKPLVIWSEGSEDDTDDEESQSIYDVIDDLKKKLDYLYSHKGDNIIPEPPTDDGKYTLRSIVENGVATYRWEANSEVSFEQDPSSSGHLNAEFTSLYLMNISDSEYKNAVIANGLVLNAGDGNIDFVRYENQ